MTIQEFRDYMASGKPVVGGGDVHMMFHKLSQEALQITAEINGKYHTPEQLHDLLEQLWGREVPKTVGMFPPFHTDCGKNTVVGERVFINMGCKFQDQGGITIDEGALIGHNVVLATINHDLDPANRQSMSYAPMGHRDRYLDSLFRVDEPVPRDFIIQYTIKGRFMSR